MEARVWSILIAGLYGAVLYLWQGILGDGVFSPHGHTVRISVPPSPASDGDGGDQCDA